MSETLAASLPPTDLETELAALEVARVAALAKVEKLQNVSGGGIDELSDEFIDSVVRHTIDKLRQELVVFGRIDDDHPWRIGLYGIDSAGEQLVVDWRARFAEGFYQATLDNPHGLRARVSYVGCIDDLMVEDFVEGGVSGSSPLMAELSRGRGAEMRTAVATLQSDQDRLVRLDPEAHLVLRGGPGTGKTVVGLHRAAWLVYNDRRMTSDTLLIIGPSDKFLRFVSSVLPTLGEHRIVQTTFDRHLGPSSEAGSDPRWLEVLDSFEASLPAPTTIRSGGRWIPEEEVAELVGRIVALATPWRERRKIFLARVANRLEIPAAEAQRVAGSVFPAMSATAAWKKICSRATLVALNTPPDLVERWMATKFDGGLQDEVKSRFEGINSRYAHVIVDEAQDLTLFQLRAVLRRAAGVTLVGDDAQRSVAGGLGLRAIAEQLNVPLEQMRTAYRMSAEIAVWLNGWASEFGIDAVELLGIRPTGREVRVVDDPGQAHQKASTRWGNVALITAEDVWIHKGVEYDAVVVDARQMTPAEVYLAASRAAHELLVHGIEHTTSSFEAANTHDVANTQGEL